MKAVEIEINGNSLCLFMNMEAYLAIDELTGGKDSYAKVMEYGKDGYQLFCKAIHILAEQGELVRRSLGYAEREIITEEQIRTWMNPKEMIEAQRKIHKLYELAFSRDIENKEDTDLVLLDIKKKKIREKD